MGLFSELGQAKRLMVFSAHPDDESTSFGGALALSSFMGMKTIVITSTDGALGDSIEGYKPENTHHDPTQVAVTRRQEILHACEILRVYKQEFLGYSDSGIRGWEHLHNPLTFSIQPQNEVIDKIQGLISIYRPEIVLTHEPSSHYQHIDHVLTGKYVTEAINSLPQKFSPKLYIKFHGKTYWDNLCKVLAQVGITRENPFTQVDENIPANLEELDVHSVISQKYDALHAHKSQLHSTTLAKLNLPLFTQALGIEHYYQVLHN